MHQFSSVYYFTLLLLHVSATVCHPHGASLYLLSYIPIWVLVDRILCSVWLCVRYLAAWCVYAHTTTYYTEFYQPKAKLAFNSESTDELPEDGTQLPKHVGASK
jgi:hypothetical protein